jgi:hypothetical protein
MPTSADLVQIAIVPEVTYGVTPATPAFYIVRTTGEGLAFVPTTTISNEMNPNRQVTDSILTGGQSSGDLNFELAYEDWFELLLAGVMCDDWTSNALVVGSTLKSFTIEKKIPVPGGTTQYHRFTGCVMNGMSINIRPNQPITGSFSVLGKAVTTAEAEIAGATYAASDLTPVMTAPRVVNIEIGGVSAVSKCFNNLQFSINNNDRVIECIGTLGPKEVVLGRMEAQAQFSVLFNDSDLLETLIDQVETSLEFQTDDNAVAGSPGVDNYYAWEFPRIKFTANPVVAGGTNTDVVNAVTAQALMQAGTLTSMNIRRKPR